MKTIWKVLIAVGTVIVLVLVGIWIYHAGKNSVNPIIPGGIPEVSWKDAVSYPAGGSGPADPASVLEGDITAVDHSKRLIVSNPDLDVRACFTVLDDDTWREIVAWSEKWGDDSPTRIEWQVNESRCSFVFPGNITDPISAEEYEELLALFPGYETWFVGGEEGSEFGRETYEQIYAVDPTFNRVHIYGPALPAMPVSQ